MCFFYQDPKVLAAVGCSKSQEEKERDDRWGYEPLPHHLILIQIGIHICWILVTVVNRVRAVLHAVTVATSNCIRLSTILPMFCQIVGRPVKEWREKKEEGSQMSWVKVCISSCAPLHVPWDIPGTTAGVSLAIPCRAVMLGLLSVRKWAAGNYSIQR